MLDKTYLANLPTPQALRKLRMHYGIDEQKEMAKKLGLDVQTYRRYEDPKIERDGLPPHIYARVKRILMANGASQEEVWQLLPGELRDELEALNTKIRDHEERMKAVEKMLWPDRTSGDETPSEDGGDEPDDRDAAE